MLLFKKILKLIIASIIAYIILLGIQRIIGYLMEYPIGNTISKNITQENIKKLMLGMKEEDVVSMLGKPFSKVHKETNFYFLEYAKRGLPLGGGIEIYVYIRNKKYTGIRMEKNDSGFYTCILKDCPKIIDKDIYNQHIPKL